MLAIGDISLSIPYILAPLAGISDLPFRTINRRFGCRFAFTEMISAQAIVYQSRNTSKMLSTIPDDRPLGVQLLGNDPEIIRRALNIMRKYKFDIIDFNAACPASKVTGKGKGAGLLKEPRKLGDLLRVVVNASDAPVTVKIRSGWDDRSINARDVALYAQDAGVSGLFIHGRTKVQGYGGRVDYAIIKEVKEALNIPVIASGDALSPQLIKKMFDETGCDGVAIARGALGNPWIFSETAEYMKSGRIPKRPDIYEIAYTMAEHLNLCIGRYGEITGVMLFRKFFGWYTRGIPDIKPLKDKAFRAKTKEDMMGVIGELSADEYISHVQDMACAL